MLGAIEQLGLQVACVSALAKFEDKLSLQLRHGARELDATLTNTVHSSLHV